MIDTVLGRSHIGQLDATFGRFEMRVVVCGLLIQYRVSQNISRLRNTLAHWCIVYSVLLLDISCMEWNVFFTHFSLTLLAEMNRKFPLQQVPSEFSRCFTASTSNLQSSNWQFSTHHMEMQRSIPPQLRFPNGKEASDRLSAINRWWVTFVVG